MTSAFQGSPRRRRIAWCGFCLANCWSRPCGHWPSDLILGHLSDVLSNGRLNPSEFWVSDKRSSIHTEQHCPPCSGDGSTAALHEEHNVLPPIFITDHTGSLGLCCNLPIIPHNLTKDMVSNEYSCLCVFI